MPVPKQCSPSELGRVLGITAQAVSKLVEAGVLRREGRGLFDLAESVQAHTRYREGIATRRAGGGEKTYSQGRAKKIWEECARLEDERKVRSGQLVELALMEGHWIAILGTLRSALLAAPRRLAPMLARLRTPEEIELALRRETDSVLNRLAKSDWRPADVADRAA